MRNPWEEISLSDYEQHMSLDSVRQLQAMNQIMKRQFNDYNVDSAMILGVAGGNGLEHVNPEKYRVVYGVDINENYLHTVNERFAHLGKTLQCLHLNIAEAAGRLPHAGLVIANLLIEYIGYEAFTRAITAIEPQYVSCVIQINTDANAWVSESPYLHAFDKLDEIHHQMSENELDSAMLGIDYKKILQTTDCLPNGKQLVRIDFLNSSLSQKTV